MSRQTIFLPAQWAVQGRIQNNPVMQMNCAPLQVEAEIVPVRNGHLCVWFDDKEVEHKTLILSKKPAQMPTDGTHVLLTHDGHPLLSQEQWEINRSKVRWALPIPVVVTEDIPHHEVRNRVHKSWKGKFSFNEEQTDEEGKTTKSGLRPAQIGALHSILSHWTVENDPATVVMPTGTGKTETMLSLLICQRPERVLILVPSVALREQIAAKVACLGVLKGFNGWGGIINSDALFPVVGKMEHGFKTLESAESFFLGANVIVANIDALTACAPAIKNYFAKWCDLLLVDETHHSAAPTWEDVRRQFRNKARPIVGFTATPYRNDQKSVEGKIIYSYPLLKVQQEGHFTPIDFKPVRKFNRAEADEAIALAAVKQLEEDIQKGWSHLVMARAADIERATEIFEIYERVALQHHPQLIHSKVPKSQQKEILRQLRSGGARIVVCVDMFGEGFDMPELKIAAIHDVHKSLPITLKFTGRFVRGRTDLGRATLIANIAANKDLNDALRALYAEDPDWNTLLCDLSTEATGRQLARSRLVRGFGKTPGGFPVQNLAPKFSAETYKVEDAEWDTDALEALLSKSQLLFPLQINHEAKVLLFVTRLDEEVKWADARDLRDISHHLNLIHFDSTRKLLFINSSDMSQMHDKWAEALCGKSAELIKGETIFRALDGLNRLVLLNAGLKDTLSQAVRFMMLVGADVQDFLKDGHVENRIKCNLFTRGFRNGQRTSVGCSAKGRVWAHAQSEDVSQWMEWCADVGDRLLDNGINMEQVLKNALIPEIVTSRPDAVPISFEWSEDTLRRGEQYLHLDFKGYQIPFFDADLQVVQPSRTGNLCFRVQMEIMPNADEGDDGQTQVLEALYEVRFEGKRVVYHPLGNEVSLCVGRKKTPRKLSEWLDNDPLIVRFHDGSWLEGNIFCKPRKDRTPFDRNKIEARDWTDTDIKKESQYKTENGKRIHHKDSIQYRVIQDLCAEDYDVIFDDDSAGESADVVALKLLDDRIQVHLFHCKFAKAEEAGERVSELYEVCGQAQKSIHWRRDIENLFRHMERRSQDWQKKYKVSRFQKGDSQKLGDIALASRELRAEFKIAIVQPGLSQTNATQDQLDLLATTEIYLTEVGAVPFRVIASQ